MGESLRTDEEAALLMTLAGELLDSNASSVGPKNHKKREEVIFRLEALMIRHPELETLFEHQHPEAYLSYSLAGE